MVNVNRETKLVEKVIEVEEVITSVILTLTPMQALALRLVIGGAWGYGVLKDELNSVFVGLYELFPNVGGDTFDRLMINGGHFSGSLPTAKDLEVQG